MPVMTIKTAVIPDHITIGKKSVSAINYLKNT